MSRRKPDPMPPVVPGSKTIRVVCTDKGQHSEVSFGHVVVSPLGDGWHVHLALNHRGREYVHMEEIGLTADRLARTYPLKCRRCGRDTPLLETTVKQVCAGLAAADTSTFDLSYLS